MRKMILTFILMALTAVYSGYLHDQNMPGVGFAMAFITIVLAVALLFQYMDLDIDVSKKKR